MIVLKAKVQTNQYFFHIICHSFCSMMQNVNAKKNVRNTKNTLLKIKIDHSFVMGPIKRLAGNLMNCLFLINLTLNKIVYGQ